jgi:ribosomal protein S12 methylthiotransferase
MQATRLPPQPVPRPKVGMISLGCAKNLVDAEIMLGSVLERGMEITSSAEDADVLVINTCAFIDSAKEESIDAILEAHQQRGLHKRANQRLIVSGCMSQRFSEELRQQLPEVDAFIGLDQVRELGTVVERVLQKHRTVECRKFGRSRFCHAAAHLHPRLRHAAFSFNPAALRLFEDR